MSKERLAHYSLTGPENQAAVDADMASGNWFRSAVPRKQDEEELTRRSDYPAVQDTRDLDRPDPADRRPRRTFWMVWRNGGRCRSSSPTACCTALDVRLALAASPERGTAFKTRWIDEDLYQLASFMIMRDPTTCRWSHTRHHLDTLVVEQDPEIAVMRPARLVELLANLIGLVDVAGEEAFRLMFVHASGQLRGDEADYVQESERPKVYRNGPSSPGHLRRHRRPGDRLPGPGCRWC